MINKSPAILTEKAVVHVVKRMEQLINAIPNRTLILTMLSAKWLCLLKSFCPHGEYTKEAQMHAHLGERKCRRRCQAFKIIVTQILLKEFTAEEIAKIDKKQLVTALKPFSNLSSILRNEELQKKRQEQQKSAVNEVDAAIRRIRRIVNSVSHLEKHEQQPLYEFLKSVVVESGSLSSKAPIPDNIEASNQPQEVVPDTNTVGQKMQRTPTLQTEGGVTPTKSDNQLLMLI